MTALLVGTIVYLYLLIVVTAAPEIENIGDFFGVFLWPVSIPVIYVGSKITTMLGG